ncbi:MAG: type II-A CRISPR-associated protein Csn2 [Candidatus Gastranaerophilales bacterium]|nr:type II-A CRISPR-associated protein Csn2 [Candidatus Gastranaerophilales bacterium]
MKLAHTIFESPIEIKENSAAVVVFENQKQFYEAIEDLYKQIQGSEGEWVLSEKDKTLDIEKHIHMITEPLSIDFNTRKIQNKLYALLKEQSFSETNYRLTSEICGQISTYATKIAENIDFPVVCADIEDPVGIFRLVDAKLEIEYKNLTEKILDYISIMQDFFNISVFAFINLKCYMTGAELETLYKACFYKKINLILFENTLRDGKSEHETEKIIDFDLCEIY